MEIVLIVEKSLVYSDFLKNLYLKNWGVSTGEVQHVSKLDEIGGTSLFGDIMPAVLTLNTPAQVKDLVKEVETLEKLGELETFKKNGLIIMANIDRRSTRKLESLLKKHGKVEVTNSKTSLSQELLKKVQLRPEVRQFLLDYVGQDYENLVPIVNILLESPKETHKNVSIEDVYIRLPKPPGAVPPWEIEKPLFQRNADEVIDVFRRVSRSSHFLVILSMLKNKLVLAYKIAVLLETGRLTDDEITAKLDIPKNYYYSKTKEISVSQGSKSLEKMIKLLVKTENNVKGGVNVKGEVQMEVMLMQLINIIGGGESE